MGGSRNHWEAIQPGKTRIFDNRYTVFVWELVSHRPVFLHFSLEACIFFTYQFPMFLFLFLGRYFLYHDHCALCCKNPAQTRQTNQVQTKNFKIQVQINRGKNEWLKYGFWKKSIRRNKTLNSWTLSSSQKDTCTNESYHLKKL